MEIKKLLTLLTALLTVPLAGENGEEKGDRYFEAGLFQEAADFYFSEMENKPDRQELTVKCAKSCFLNGDYKQAAELLNRVEKRGDDLSLILGTCCRKVHQWDQAAAILAPLADHSEHARLELARTFLENEEFEQALQILERDKGKPEPDLLRARSLIETGRLTEGENIIQQLEVQFPDRSRLACEISFLKGKIAFLRKDYASSATFFRKAVPAKNEDLAPWTADSLHDLAASLVQSAEDSPNQEELLNEAEGAFLKLWKKEPGDRSFLALGKFYLAKGKVTGRERVYKQAEKHLNKKWGTVSEEAACRALLLLAEEAPSAEKKEKACRTLLDRVPKSSPFYAEAWKRIGLLAISRQEYGKAADAFEKARPEGGAETPELLKLLAESYYRANTPEKKSRAAHLLKRAFEGPDPLYLRDRHPDSFHYLLALALSELGNEEKKEAESHLKTSLHRFPEGKFASDSLRLLGTLQFRSGSKSAAKETFLELYRKFPDAQSAGEALFFASQCCEEHEEGAKYRRLVYEAYPGCPVADQAYFLSYSFKDYLLGEAQAMEHLKKMPLLFPDSPYLVYSYYLTGLDHKRDKPLPQGGWVRKKNLFAAIEAFGNAAKSFDTLQTEVDKPLIEIRYRALLEQALANQSIADHAEGPKKKVYLEHASQLLSQITEEFENPDHPLASRIAEGESYHPLLEEADLALAKALIHHRRQGEAEALLKRMLDRYRACKVTKGCMISRVLTSLGSLAMDNGDYREALSYFLRAVDGAKGKSISTDERLELLIQTSICQKELGELEKSMLTLSDVINENVVSSLRVKAMLLRAELYERQGRRELAKKQLESVSKKGGEWGAQAKQQLEKHYAYK